MGVMTVVASEPGTCAFPGCDRPARPPEGNKPTKYCDVLNARTGKYAHTSLSAAREKAKRERAHEAADAGEPTGGERPASAARNRAETVLDQFRAEAVRLQALFDEGVAALAQAADPEVVGAEVSATEQAMRRLQVDTEEELTAARAERDRALAQEAQALEEITEAVRARDEAMSELEASETGERLAMAEARSSSEARDAAQDEAARAEAHNEQLQREVASLKSSLTEEQARVVKERSTAAGLRADLATMTAQLKAAEDTLAGEQAHNAEWRAMQKETHAERVKDFRDEIAELRRQLADSQLQKETHAERVKDFRDEIAELRRQLPDSD